MLSMLSNVASPSDVGHDHQQADHLSLAGDRVANNHRSTSRSSSERAELGQRKRKCPTAYHPTTGITPESERLPVIIVATQRTQSEERKSSIVSISSSQANQASDFNKKRIRSRSASNTSAVNSPNAGIPSSEYRWQFRCPWFHPIEGNIDSHLAAAAGRPSERKDHSINMMTRSATSETLKRDLLPIDRDTEYKSKFKEFNDYIYVDDVHGFRFKHPDATTDAVVADEAEGATGGGGTWYDQFNERHGQAIVFAKRSYAGHPFAGFESLSKMYEELQFPYPKDRQLNALSLATTRLVMADKRKERSPRSQSVMAGGSTTKSRESKPAAEKKHHFRVQPEVTLAAAGTKSTSTGKRKHSGKASKGSQEIGKRNPVVAAAASSSSSAKATAKTASGRGSTANRALSPPGKVWMQAKKSSPVAALPATDAAASAMASAPAALPDAEAGRDEESAPTRGKRSISSSRSASIASVNAEAGGRKKSVDRKGSHAAVTRKAASSAANDCVIVPQSHPYQALESPGPESGVFELSELDPGDQPISVTKTTDLMQTTAMTSGSAFESTDQPKDQVQEHRKSSADPDDEESVQNETADNHEEIEKNQQNDAKEDQIDASGEAQVQQEEEEIVNKTEDQVPNEAVTSRATSDSATTTSHRASIVSSAASNAADVGDDSALTETELQSDDPTLDEDKTAEVSDEITIIAEGHEREQRKDSLPMTMENQSHDVEPVTEEDGKQGEELHAVIDLPVKDAGEKTDENLVTGEKEQKLETQNMPEEKTLADDDSGPGISSHRDSIASSISNASNAGDVENDREPGGTPVTKSSAKHEQRKLSLSWQDIEEPFSADIHVPDQTATARSEGKSIEAIAIPCSRSPDSETHEAEAAKADPIDQDHGDFGTQKVSEENPAPTAVDEIASHPDKKVTPVSKTASEPAEVAAESLKESIASSGDKDEEQDPVNQLHEKPGESAETDASISPVQKSTGKKEERRKKKEGHETLAAQSFLPEEEPVPTPVPEIASHRNSTASSMSTASAVEDPADEKETMPPVAKSAAEDTAKAEHRKDSIVSSNEEKEAEEAGTKLHEKPVESGMSASSDISAKDVKNDVKSAEKKKDTELQSDSGNERELNIPLAKLSSDELADEAADQGITVKNGAASGKDGELFSKTAEKSDDRKSSTGDQKEVEVDDEKGTPFSQTTAKSEDRKDSIASAGDLNEKQDSVTQFDEKPVESTKGISSSVEKAAERKASIGSNADQGEEVLKSDSIEIGSDHKPDRPGEHHEDKTDIHALPTIDAPEVVEHHVSAPEDEHTKNDLNPKESEPLDSKQTEKEVANDPAFQVTISLADAPVIQSVLKAVTTPAQSESEQKEEQEAQQTIGKPLSPLEKSVSFESFPTVIPNKDPVDEVNDAPLGLKAIDEESSSVASSSDGKEKEVRPFDAVIEELVLTTSAKAEEKNESGKDPELKTDTEVDRSTGAEIVSHESSSPDQMAANVAESLLKTLPEIQDKNNNTPEHECLDASRKSSIPKPDAFAAAFVVTQDPGSEPESFDENQENPPDQLLAREVKDIEKETAKEKFAFRKDSLAQKAPVASPESDVQRDESEDSDEDTGSIVTRQPNLKTDEKTVEAGDRKDSNARLEISRAKEAGGDSGEMEENIVKAKDVVHETKDVSKVGSDPQVVGGKESDAQDGNMNLQVVVEVKKQVPETSAKSVNKDVAAAHEASDKKNLHDEQAKHETSVPEVAVKTTVAKEHMKEEANAGVPVDKKTGEETKQLATSAASPPKLEASESIATSAAEVRILDQTITNVTTPANTPAATGSDVSANGSILLAQDPEHEVRANAGPDETAIK